MTSLEESEPDVESLLEAIEDANDSLAEALEDAQRYAEHEEVRASAIRGFDRVQEAHERLGDVDPTRETEPTCPECGDDRVALGWDGGKRVCVHGHEWDVDEGGEQA